MKKLLGTTAVIEEAGVSSMRRKFWMISLIFFSVYLVGSLLSGIFLFVPMSYIISDNDELMEILSSGTESEVDIYNILLESIPEWFYALQLFAMIGLIISVFYYCSRCERRRIVTLGFIKKSALSESLFGALIGLLMFVFVYATGIIVSGGSIVFNESVSIPYLLLFFLGFAVQAFSEEIFFRGFYFVSGAYTKNVPVALFASSFVYALFLYSSVEFNPLLFLNLFLFATFAALYFLRRGNIWGVATFHTIWNFSSANIFGFGYNGTVFETTVFKTIFDDSNKLLIGGPTGLNGGLLVTIVLFVGIIVLLPLKNKLVTIPPVKLKGEFYSA